MSRGTKLAEMVSLSGSLVQRGILRARNNQIDFRSKRTSKPDSPDGLSRE